MRPILSLLALNLKMVFLSKSEFRVNTKKMQSHLFTKVSYNVLYILYNTTVIVLTSLDSGESDGRNVMRPCCIMYVAYKSVQSSVR